MNFFGKIKGRFLALTLAACILGGSIGCHGGFVLTSKWNGLITSIGNKWIRWIVFLVLSFVYGFTILADAIVFNSVEFWTGSNPVALNYNEKGEYTRTLTSGSETAVMTYRNFGETLDVALFKNGVQTDSLRLIKSEPGVLYRQSNGQFEKIIVSEETRGDLRIIRAGEKSAAVPAAVYQVELARSGSM